MCLNNEGYTKSIFGWNIHFSLNLKEVRQTFSKCHEFDGLWVKWKLIKIFSTF